MTKKGRRTLAGLAVLSLLAAGIWTGREIRRREETAREQERLEKAARETEAETEEIKITEAETTAEAETEGYVSPIDFEALWEVNPDVVGWITIPDTNIDYPILQAEDNDTYLHTDLEGNDSVAGAIFLDFEDEKDFSSLHNVIYGHHMKNGSMFKDIVRFKEQAYFDEHSDFYIDTPERRIHLKALAALYTTPDAVRRKTDFESEEDFDSYVAEMTKKASAGAEPEQKVTKLYSLITCSYEFADARTILYAYEVEEESAVQSSDGNDHGSSDKSGNTAVMKK